METCATYSPPSSMTSREVARIVSSSSVARYGVELWRHVRVCSEARFMPSSLAHRRARRTERIADRLDLEDDLFDERRVGAPHRLHQLGEREQLEKATTTSWDFVPD